MTQRLQLSERGDGVVVVTLDRPQAMNAFDTAMAEEMLALFGTTLRRRDDIRAVVLTGAGERAFSVGADLKERAGMTNDAWRKQHALYRDTFESLWNFPWPIIAAVRGYALGGGCELPWLRISSMPPKMRCLVCPKSRLESCRGRVERSS